jgi:hypothetical protein
MKSLHWILGNFTSLFYATISPIVPSLNGILATYCHSFQHTKLSEFLEQPNEFDEVSTNNELHSSLHQ